MSKTEINLTTEQKFKAVACANRCWDDAKGNYTEAKRLFRRRQGGCESVLIWIQIAAALLQIAYVIWKWRKENLTDLPTGQQLEAIIAEADARIDQANEVQQ